ncbi:CULLIN-2 domain-containing protein [Mycena venus]|uniref:CULLIN-2 domain-containing protein n=1 Tax=Mycena venus TaxID=2733690 RepID=A0A8H6Y0Q6_9AGAR|nr:CULLIN-2 domain-containing protein [Mycena venus]
MAGSEAQDLWNTKLEPPVLQILTGSEPITYATHTAVYSAGYNYILAGKGNNNNCRDLYASVKLFFSDYTQRISAKASSDDSSLPAYYDAEWDRFSRGVEIVNRLLDYLNRHYVNRERDEGKKAIITVRNLAFVSWKTNVFESLLPRLENTEEADKTQLETIRQCFASEELKADSIKNMHVQAAHAS